MSESTLLNRFPTIELSYETFAHKKVYTPGIVLAIPFGVKYYIWVTFGETQGEHACYSLELNRNKKIVAINKLPHAEWYSRYAQGTILYGTWSNNVFVTEDIYYYRGIYLRNVNCPTRLKYLYDLLSDIRVDNICLAQTFLANSTDDILSYKNSSGVTIHHLQVRHIENVAPYLNIVLDRNGDVPSTLLNEPDAGVTKLPAKIHGSIVPDYRRPQYRLPTVFSVRADIQPDIYSLFTAEDQYFGVAYIPSYQKSIYMNSLFRRIRENKCIESAEDSEDEEDFENISPDKFVDLSKKILMECVWSAKFKKWIPEMVVGNNATSAVAMKELITLDRGSSVPMNIKNGVDTSKYTNGTHRGGEKYPTKTAGGVGGLRGQYQRNSRGETQFIATRRYPENGRFAQKIREPARVSAR